MTREKDEKKEKLLAVASSAQMLQYQKKKEDEKKRITEEKEDKKRKREEKKKEVEALKSLKRQKLPKKLARKETLETSSESEEVLSNESGLEWHESSDEEEEPEQVQNKKALKKGDLVLMQCASGKRNAMKSTSLCVIQEKFSFQEKLKL